MTSTQNKYKQYAALRGSAIQRMAELKTIAERALEEPALRPQLVARYKYIDNIFEDYHKQHNAIITLLSTQEDVDINEHENNRSMFEEEYFSIQVIFSELFEKKISPEPNSLNERNHIKLPKIEMMKFSGDVKQFRTFIDLYNSMVHNNNTLSEIEKFSYLISVLRGPPLNLVQCTPMVKENYLDAYNALVQRYENKRLIAFAHFREIEETQKLSENQVTSQNLRHLLDVFNENIAALRNLKLPVEKWDFVLVFMLLKRLDSDTLTRFELEFGSNNDIPSYETLSNFIIKQCTALDAVEFSAQKKSRKPESRAHMSQSHMVPKQSSTFLINANNSRTKSSLTNSNKRNVCSLCKSDHLIYTCSNFLLKSPQERFTFIKQNGWCVNCLGTRHILRDCTSQQSCKVCHKRHHSLLHFSEVISQPTPPDFNPVNNLHSQEPSASQPSTSSSNNNHSTQFSSVNTLTSILTTKTTVLLSTAQINIQDVHGNYHKVRALLDCGSMANFITKKCANRLGLPKFKSNVSINGLGHMQTSANLGGLTCEVSPIDNPTSTFKLDAVILEKICTPMPHINLEPNSFSHISHLQLADPEFNISSSVDLLLGADIFPLILQNGRIEGHEQEPSAINTVFGWILMGRIKCLTNNPITTLFSSLDTLCLDDTLKKFWELEEIPQAPIMSPDARLCEKSYASTFRRDNSGRYIVSLPFRTHTPTFTDTRTLALRRFLSLERRLLQNPTLYEAYSTFMQDYLDSHHMEKITNDITSTKTYYIPHHCVLKPDSPTTKLRVVFDASAKDSNNLSLNDTLLTGPKLQNDIVTLLLNFRMHAYVFTADIKQMYRQILITPEHRDYQRILWRFSPQEPIQDFRLKTITYGLSSSPFGALRTLQQLAKDENANYPIASKILISDSFMDDIVSGSQSLESALSLQNELICLLKKGGFELRKWASNTPQLLSHLSEDLLQNNSLALDFEENPVIKILGLQWHPMTDSFSYSVQPFERECTKRTLLSELARIYDPLGFLAPLTFFSKLLIQQLWTLGLSWDEKPPQEVINHWTQYKKELLVFKDFQLPRRIICDNILACDLHGFCDSSSRGFASVVYFRVLSPDNYIKTFLICAKSKVAPLKRISIPRLELCAAVLLADLMSFVMKTFKDKISFNKIYAWSDSMVALSWLKSDPYRWKTFVSNRVTHVQNTLPPTCWHYVPSLENPADCASRGILPSKLVDHPLWWTGPPWLKESENNFPSPAHDFKRVSSEIKSEEKLSVFSTLVTLDSLGNLLEKYSSLDKIQRIVAYMLRFLFNARRPLKKRAGAITIAQLHEALLMLVKYVQQTSFAQDINYIKNGKLSSKALRKLNPFLDDENMLRVGGRLSHSNLSHSVKHPALLPRDHRLTTLIIEQIHKTYLHPGVQTMQYLLMQHFWVLSSKRAVRKVLAQCHTCWHLNPTPLQPPMGNLPLERISQIKSFSVCGVDFGGPVQITHSKIRGAKVLKSYICLFVCFSTKALHLELCSDLTTEAFLAALRRFIARRGRCSSIHSDCGTNFVGAQKYLKQIMQSAVEHERIEWHFNPPSAPHFGGLWEAGIKSVKTHLKRVIGEQILTYEELNTVLVQIEAVLNSRPLCPLSSDPNDLSVLTPGHFLTLQPLTALPDPDLSHLNLNRLTRWQLLQHLHQTFWKRWCREYLHTLQQRGKWTSPSTPIIPGTLVLIKNELLPPLKWQMGRVIETHSGNDGVSRVVTLRTLQGILKRPVVKVCPLPNL